MPNKNLKELGARLRTARNSRGFTLDQLSDRSGYSSRHIANIEKGDVNPSFEVLFNLVKALGVSFDTVFDPADEQMEVEIQEIAGLYRACPEQGRRLILIAIRAMAHEMMDTSNEN
ncbi:MAG: helix-turn-helix domain-containing protein [Oscillospiraceae bacterium]|nr:helix-turn-helix domain-containing protein [Oscillospiraceae bacterium]